MAVKITSPTSASFIDNKATTPVIYINKTRTVVIASRNEPEDYSLCKNERCNRKFIPEHARQSYCTRKCAKVWGQVINKQNKYKKGLL